MLPSTSFYFLRHGETDWNRAKRWQGRSNIPLNATGIRQAVEARHKLAGLGITHVITSPLSRAAKTAEIIAGGLNLAVDFDHRLKERNYGAFEGLNWEETRAAHNVPEGQSHEHIMPPDSEPRAQVLARLQECITFWQTSYPQSKPLFVSHGACFSTLHPHLCPHDNHVGAKNCQPYRFQPTSSGWELQIL